MKILTGVLKGQTLLFKPNPHLRPTADKAKKAIFDMLKEVVSDARVLDLFSGTGALGFEALSGGAKSVTFVESDRTQAKRISENLERLGLSDRGTVVTGDAAQVLNNLSASNRRFNLIFMDPPYESGWGVKMTGLLARMPVMDKNSFLVLECRVNEETPEAKGGLEMVKSKTYGDTKVIIYFRREAMGT